MEPVGPVLTFLDFCGTISRVFKKKTETQNLPLTD